MTMNEKIFNDFCRERNLAKGSIAVYRHALGKYAEFNEMPLWQLLQEAEDEEEQGIRWKRRHLKSRLIDFRNYLIDYGYAKETVTNIMKRVRAFYRHYEIEIHHLPRVNIQSTVEIRIPTREDLQLAVEASKPLMRAIIMFLASSGVPKVDCLKLTIEDFIEATREYHNGGEIMEVLDDLNGRDDVIPTFSLTRTKTNKHHYTFCSPEAVTSILNYLYSRKDKLTLESPLFKISYLWLSINFGNLNEALGLGVTAGNNYGVLRCHTLRKYHATTLRDDGLSIDIINSLQGKAKNKVDAAYYVDTPEKLKEMYSRHVNCLYITDVERYKSESERLLEENREYKENLNDLWSELNDIRERQRVWDDLKFDQTR